jgi:hypothetical protein
MNHAAVGFAPGPEGRFVGGPVLATATHGTLIGELLVRQ